MRSQPASMVTAMIATTGRLSRASARTRPGYPWPSVIQAPAALRRACGRSAQRRDGSRLSGSSAAVVPSPDELQTLEHVGDRRGLVVDESRRQAGALHDIEVDVGVGPRGTLWPRDPEPAGGRDGFREGLDPLVQRAYARHERDDDVEVAPGAAQERDAGRQRLDRGQRSVERLGSIEQPHARPLRDAELLPQRRSRIVLVGVRTHAVLPSSTTPVERLSPAGRGAGAGHTAGNAAGGVRGQDVFARAAPVTPARVTGSNSPQIATARPMEIGTNAVPTANAIGVAVASQRGGALDVVVERSRETSPSRVEP